MNAAFLAADAQEPIRMAHVLQAARAEYMKLEKPLTGAEIGDWIEGRAAGRRDSTEDVKGIAR